MVATANWLALAAEAALNHRQLHKPPTHGWYTPRVDSEAQNAASAGVCLCILFKEGPHLSQDVPKAHDWSAWERTCRAPGDMHGPGGDGGSSPSVGFQASVTTFQPCMSDNSHDRLLCPWQWLPLGCGISHCLRSIQDRSANEIAADLQSWRCICKLWCSTAYKRETGSFSRISHEMMRKDSMWQVNSNFTMVGWAMCCGICRPLPPPCCCTL